MRIPIAVLSALSSALLATVTVASPAAAQAVRTVAVIADSTALAGDSASAVAILEEALRRNGRDGAAWHQLGLISWNMAKSKRSGGFMRDSRTIALVSCADSALRLATTFSPDSARFWLSLVDFNLTSGVSTLRFASGLEAETAFKAAVRARDTLLMAQAADVVGMAVWRRYEPVVNRAIVPTGMGVSLASIQRNQAADYLRSIARPIEPPTGNADYVEAFEKFRLAAIADRTRPVYSRHFYMALGERGRWQEMRDAARQRVAQYPLDVQSWQALGLAAHRLNDDREATMAFDSAAAAMDEPELERMTRFTRILRPTPQKDRNGKDILNAGIDARSFGAMAEGPRRGLEGMFWMMSDPLALTTENEYRLEFLSRVVWADMRYTDESLGLRGADTDRGDILVRYGPPPEQMTVAANPNQPLQAVTLAWIYRDDLTFFFDITPGFATAKTFFADKDYVNRVKADIPVRWDNVAVARLLDTIPVRIARFRAGIDSVDAVVAASVPIDSLVRGLGMTRTPIDVDFRMYDQFVKVRGVESVQTSFAPDSANAPQARTWTRRLGPGINVIRVEALQADSKRAARAMMRVDPERTAGFGMSDVLLGGKPELRNAARPAARWTDVSIVPNVGVYGVGASIGLLWEMYDLMARDGQVKYRVSVSVDRTDRSAIGRFTASIVDGVGQRLGREQRSRNSFTYTFDRTAGPTPTVVEFFSLALADASPGAYRLRVDVTDLANGAKTGRQTEFTIR